MASTAIPTFNLPALLVTVKRAGKMLLELPSSDRVSETKHYGEVINQMDLNVQKFLFDELKLQFPDAIFVGEEDITGPCRQKFPERDPGQLFVILDPCDGSNNYANNSDDYAVTVSLQLGNTPFYGISYMPKRDIVMQGGLGIETTINHEPLGGLRAFDEANLRVGYGLGKRKPENIRNAFKSLITGLTDDHFRLGCLSASLLAFLRGDTDLYVSLKEEWYKGCAAYAILQGILLDDGKQQWVTNIDPATLNINDAFSFSVATPDAAAAYLAPGSELAKYLEN